MIPTDQPGPLPSLHDAKRCPFCGARELRIAWWSDDDGEYDAIECLDCKAAAPASVWNRRAPVLMNERNASLDEALNSGDGIYRP